MFDYTHHQFCSYHDCFCCKTKCACMLYNHFRARQALQFFNKKKQKKSFVQLFLSLFACNAIVFSNNGIFWPHNACRMKTRLDGMASVRSTSWATSNKKKSTCKVCHPFCARASLLIFFLKKNGKNASRTLFAALFA